MTDILGELKKNPKQTAILITLVSVIGLIAYINFVLLSQIRSVAAQITTAKKMRSELAAAEKDAAGVSLLEKEIFANKEKINKYEKMLPAEQEIPELLEELSGMAKAANVKIVAITPVTASKADTMQKDRVYQEIPILVSARSGYHELGRFLNSFENCDRFMKVVDMEIKANKSALTRHDVELLITTYVLLKEK